MPANPVPVVWEPNTADRFNLVVQCALDPNYVAAHSECGDALAFVRSNCMQIPVSGQPTVICRPRGTDQNWLDFPTWMNRYYYTQGVRSFSSTAPVTLTVSGDPTDPNNVPAGATALPDYWPFDSADAESTAAAQARIVALGDAQLAQALAAQGLTCNQWQALSSASGVSTGKVPTATALLTAGAMPVNAQTIASLVSVLDGYCARQSAPPPGTGGTASPGVPAPGAPAPGLPTVHRPGMSAGMKATLIIGGVIGAGVVIRYAFFRKPSYPSAPSGAYGHPEAAAAR